MTARAGGLERFEVEHRLGQPLDGAMILLAMLLRYLTWRTRIGTSRPVLIASMAALLAPLIATLFGSPFVPMALPKKRRRGHLALRHQQKVDGLSLLVDGAVEVFPDTLDLDVRLIHAPAAADRALAFPRHLLYKRQETNCPPVDR